MRSVNNKSDYIQQSTCTSIYDIIALSETWLKPCQSSNEFMSANYKTFRKDRENTSLTGHIGGGVLIALKHEIDAVEFSTPEMADLEAICVKITLSDCCVFVYCNYVQPSASMDTYKNHIQAIKSIENQRSSKDIAFYCGDWNMPVINWVESDDETHFIPLLGDSQSQCALIANFVTTEMFAIRNLPITASRKQTIRQSEINFKWSSRRVIG